MVTTLYAGILGLIYLALASFTIAGRFKYRISLGDSGNSDMLRRIRAHGNFMEYVPITLVLMILAEVEGGSETFLHLMGGALVIARLAHVVGVYIPSSHVLWRRGGITLTLLVILLIALFCIKSYFVF